MSEDEVILVRETAAAQESLNRLLRVVENWVSKEAQRTDFELAAVGCVLAEGIVNFGNIPVNSFKAYPGLTKAITIIHKHLTKEHHRFDQEIDKLHVHFAKKMEELDLKIIRDRTEFRKFLEILVFADEYDLLHAKLSSLLESVQAKTFYRGSIEEGGKEEEEEEEEVTIA